jgi:hypothetical protein
MAKDEWTEKGMRHVRFLRHASPYMAGEVATFGAAHANNLVKKGIAEICDIPASDAVHWTKPGEPVAVAA